MCEVHLVYSVNGKLTAYDLHQLCEMLYLGAVRNKDGFGLFNEKGEVFKKERKFTHKFTAGIISKFKGSRFVVAHNRMATHGEVKEKNTHPFRVGNFLFVHNGIIWNHDELKSRHGIETKATTDSIVLGYLIDSHYKKTGDMAASIKETAKEVKGQYSVFVFNMKTGELCYFKNNAEMEFAKIKRKRGEVVVASTDEKNLLQIYKTFRNGIAVCNYGNSEKMKTEDETVYRVSESGVTKIGEFEPNNDYWESLSWGQYGFSREEDLEDSLREFYPDIEIRKVSGSHARVSSPQFIANHKELFTNYIKGTITFDNLEWILEGLIENWNYRGQYY